MNNILSRFFNLPIINDIDVNENTIYGYAECSWNDVPEYKGNYKNALQSDNHVWKCYRGNFSRLKERYISFLTKNESRLDRIPDREYEQYDENVFFQGTVFLILENNLPVRIFTSAREDNCVLRDLSMLQGNCPAFVWNI